MQVLGIQVSHCTSTRDALAPPSAIAGAEGHRDEYSSPNHAPAIRQYKERPCDSYAPRQRSGYFGSTQAPRRSAMILLRVSGGTSNSLLALTVKMSSLTP